MRTKAGPIPGAIMLVALAGVGFSPGFAWAQDACLGAPNAPAPPGSHWYYRTDPSTQQKCWHLKAPDQTGQAPAQQKPATPIAAAAPAGAAARPTLTPTPWPNPDPQSGPASVVWPDPPSVPPPVDNAGTSYVPASTDASAPQPRATDAPAAASAQPTSEPSPTAAQPDKDSLAVKPPDEPGKATVRKGGRGAGLLLGGMAGLLMAGLILRAMIATSFGRRRKIKGLRREPVLIEPIGGKRPMPTQLWHSPSLVPSSAETEHRIHEVEEALRNLAQRLQRRRSTPFKIVPQVEAWIRS